MPGQDEVPVSDTGPLSHFAEQGWLGLLRALVGERTAVVPDTVVAELQEGVHSHAHLRLVLDARWLEHRSLIQSAEIAEFATFAARLAERGRNTGECGVLALSVVHHATPVLDDGPARKIAREHGIIPKGTLGLMIDAIRGGLLTIDLASTVADHLIESEYRLPFGPGGFKQWAIVETPLDGVRRSTARWSHEPGDGVPGQSISPRSASRSSTRRPAAGTRSASAVPSHASSTTSPCGVSRPSWSAV